MFLDSTETQERRRVWLDQLKIGDTVGVCNYGRMSDYIEKTLITGITPTRKFRVEGSKHLFDASGCSRRENWHELVEWTKEIENGLAHKALVSRVMHYLDLGGIDPEKVEAASDEDLTQLLNMARRFKRDAKT